MKRRTLIILLLCCMMLLFTGCAQQMQDATDPTQPITPSAGPAPAEADIVLLVTGDVSTAPLQHQRAWQGVKTMTEYNSTCTAAWYAVADAAAETCLPIIQEAVKNGAQTVILPDADFANTAYEAQYLYPEVSFLLLDGTPHAADYSATAIEKNTCVLTYSAEQCGFMAGYAAVAEGYRSLGFMGGLAVPEVVAYGCGFLQGANRAAQDLQVQVNIRYTYTRCITEAESIQTWAGSWYANGTEVIFACAEEADRSILAATKVAGAKLIVTNFDYTHEDADNILCSVGKNTAGAVNKILREQAEGQFPGGLTLQMDVSTESIGIQMDQTTFRNFTDEQYTLLYLELQRGNFNAQPITDPLYDVTTLVSPAAVTLSVE